jgi:Mn2+/Fe2+ NRAMP family transporter
MDTDGMSADGREKGRAIAPVFRWLAAVGPGMLVMLADTDAGNVVTAAQAGAQWRYRLLPLILALIPALFMVQELAARLGVFTGRGFGELVREKFGVGWARLALAALALATFGTLVTEFTAVAGIGELYGISRAVSLPAACAALLAVAATGSYRRVERIALIVGLFEGAFLIVAWKAHPEFSAMAHDAVHAPLGDANFLFLAAAIIGSVFNPWMVFYQQAATARKGLQPSDYRAAQWDTALGAVLTQALTGAVLVAAAGALFHGDRQASLESIGQVVEALSATLGAENGRLIFSLGVLGASFAAAIVAALALSWGVAEISGARRQDNPGLFDSPVFLGLFAASIAAAAALAGFSNDLVWLNIAAQLGNSLLFPVVTGLLVMLAARVLDPGRRLHGAHLLATVVIAASVAVVGVVGLVAGLY